MPLCDRRSNRPSWWAPWAIDSTFDSPEQPFVAFVDDGTWTASDGCNRVQGTYELGDLGALTTTSGPSTLMACDGAQLPLAVTMADYVQVSGDVLTIASSADSTITTLVRSTDPTVGPQDKPVGQWIESDAADAPFPDARRRWFRARQRQLQHPQRGMDARR